MPEKLTKKRKYLLTFVSITIFVVVIALLLELIIWLFSPRTTIYPAMKYSAEYGAVLYENEVIVHKRPRNFTFKYTINDLGYRGPATPISNTYEKPNLLILGDSFSFGTGVNDGDEYASVLREELKDKYNVINLGVGGWGLTQQIRRFYEFGVLYQPKIVILQFFHNDPVDNLNNQVTVIEDGRFKFQDSNSNTNWAKKFISHSLIQKSQLYTMLRTGALHFFKHKIDEAQKKEFAERNQIMEIPAEEKYHVDLLKLFAADLKEKGIKLYAYSVNEALPLFPYIESSMKEMDKNGEFDFIDIDPWFKTPEDVEPSPAGHYGTRWNTIMGKNLAEYVRNHEMILEKDSVSVQDQASE
jgi:hypothetical protein